jgi:hypothetical protein
MPEGRPQLYKIRRLIKKDGQDVYEYVGDFKGPIDKYSCATWVELQIDGYPFTHISEARRFCEKLKLLNDDSDVIFHSVVPA